MDHFAAIDGVLKTQVELVRRRSIGSYYTPSQIGRVLASSVAREMDYSPQRWRIVDPFCGDGRLVEWLAEDICRLRPDAARRLELHLWDVDESALRLAHARMTSLAERLAIEYHVERADTFERVVRSEGAFDAVITNPPWEGLKPDPGERDLLGERLWPAYLDGLRATDRRLRSQYPIAAPRGGYSGWGLNLSRVGTEAAVRLARAGGVVGLVTPTSLAADRRSEALRHWLFFDNAVRRIDYYPAEAKLFSGADQGALSWVVSRLQSAPRVDLVVHGKCGDVLRQGCIEGLSPEDVRLGLAPDVALEATEIREATSECPTIAELEGGPRPLLTLGRELDETRISERLADSGQIAFVKGRMVGRFGLLCEPDRFLRDSRSAPATAHRARVTWRDVSRASQTRRLQAAMLPAGYVTGNSLGIAVARDDNSEVLGALLAVMNSLVFELLVRLHLSTNHVSLSAVRLARVPDLRSHKIAGALCSALDASRVPVGSTSPLLEVAVAKSYGLARDEFAVVLEAFPALDSTIKKSLMAHTTWGTS